MWPAIEFVFFGPIVAGQTVVHSKRLCASRDGRVGVQVGVRQWGRDRLEVMSGL